MPTLSANSDSALEAQAFWFRYRREIAAVLVIAIVALIGLASVRFYREKRDRDAAALLSSAKGASDYAQVTERFAGTPAAASAYILLAETQRKEHKFAEANATLKNFLDKSPSHELETTSRMAMAANLESLGKQDEALTLYQQIGAVGANFNAPYAMLAQAQILQTKGRTDDARRVYETIMTQYRESFASMEAARLNRTLKPASRPQPAASVTPSVAPGISPAP